MTSGPDIVLRVWRRQPGQFFCVSTKSRSGTWRDKFFARSDLKAARAFIEANGDKDLYWCPHGFRRRKRTKEASVTPTLLWADLDPVDPSTLNGLHPSIAWESSPKRYAALWSLDGDMTEDLNQRLTYHLGADKGGWALTKVLRIPGTANYKYDDAPVGRLLWDDGPTYKPDDLDEHLPETSDATASPDDLYQKYENALSADVRRELLNGRPQVGKRSDVLWSLAHGLLEAGATRDEAFILLRRCAWSEKYKDGALRKQIDKALGQHTAPSKTPGTFEHELAAALADITAHLEAGTSDAEVVPLFEPAVDLLTRRFPATPWLVKGLITENGTAVIAGEPKTGKSWAATEIALAVATGTPAFGRFETTAKTVAYFYAEDTPLSVQTHLRALARGRGLDPSEAVGRLHVQPRGRFLDICRNEDLALIVASCRRLGPIGLLVLDPLRNVHSGIEDKSDSMSPVFHRLRLLGDLLKCTVLLIHHVSKDSSDTTKRRPGQRMRGSSAIHGSIDAGIYFSKLTGDGTNEFINTVQSEVKGAKSAGRFVLTLTIEDGLDGTAVRTAWSTSERDEPKRDTTDEVQAIVDALADGPLSEAKLRRKVGRATAVVRDILAEAKRRGLITKCEGGRGWQVVR